MAKSFFDRQPVCSACGWTGKYTDAKHRSHNQLRERRVIDDRGHIIDPYLLLVQERQDGVIDLAWCPKCDCFIEIYLDNEKAEET